MLRETYYTLVASLPYLPHFEGAGWLPISRKQLDQRLSMLAPKHARQLRLAEGLVHWQQQPVTRTNEEVVDRYESLMGQLGHPALREFVEYRMAQRTAVVALRRRRRGLGPPARDEVWGVGPWVRTMLSAWDRADLGIGFVFPWIEEAGRLLEAGDARELERVLLGSVWERLARIAQRRPFGFEPVISFVFRWDILQRWLSYDAQAGGAHFQELISEVTREHQQLFA